MKIIRATLLLSAIALLGSLTWIAWELLPYACNALVSISTASQNLTRVAVSIPEIVDARTGEALSVVKQSLTTADRQLSDTRADIRGIAGKLDEPLTAATEAIENLSGIRTDLREMAHDIQPILSNVRLISNRLQETSDSLLDCRGHGACLPAQTLALVGSARFTLGQVARSAPAAVASFQGIQGSIQRSAGVFERGFPVFVSNTNAITGNIATITKPKWWESPLKAAVAGAVVAGSLK